MKRTLLAIVAGAFALAAGAAHAQVDAKKAEAAAKQAGCLACHAVSAKKVGPSLQEAGAKFKGAPDKLVAALQADKDHADSVKALKGDDLKLVASWIASL